MIVDGWNYDMAAAPRSEDIEIIAIPAAAPEDRYDYSSPTRYLHPVAAIFWHDEDHARGWTTGGCNRYRDQDFRCWRPFPPEHTKEGI